MSFAKRYLKFVVSVAMVALVSYKVDLREVWRLVSHLSPAVYLIGITGYLLSLVISSFRWWRLARAAGLQCTFTKTLAATLIGSYANAFGLGTIGGDVLKAALIGLQQGSTKNGNALALASVAADRVLGLGVLATIGVMGASFVVLPGSAHQYIFVAAAVVLLGAAFWFSVPMIFTYLERYSWFNKLLGGAGKAFPRDGKVLLEIVGIAAVFHVVQIGVLFILAHLINAPIPFTYMLAAVPIANIIATLPLSWMGLGVRDGLFVMLFTPIFMTSESAIILSTLWLVSMMGASVIGGVVAVLRGELSVTAARSKETSSGDESSLDQKQGARDQIDTVVR